MIAQKNRFKGHASLNYVYRHGKVIRQGSFGFKYAPNPRRLNWRLSVVVSKKTAKLAVDRNHIRRRVYETFRKMILEHKPNLSNLDMIVTVYDARLAELPQEKLDQLVIDCLQKSA